MRLHRPGGPAPRVLAPGIPSWLGLSCGQPAWATRDVLFWCAADEIVAVQLPDEIDDVVADDHGFTVAMALGAARVSRVTEKVERLLSIDEGEPLQVRPGSAAVLVVAVPEHGLIRVTDGAPVVIPDGATRARFIAPYADKPGIVWIDRDALFRWEEGRRVTALGRASGAVAMAVGPGGSVIVGLEGDTLCAAPAAVAVRLGVTVDVESARFSADGRRALAADEAGILEIDVVKGEVLQRWEGAAVPVGFAAAAVRWNRTTGALEGAELAISTGFAGATAGCGESWLAGPGGAVWDVATGVAIRQDVGPGVAATDGSVVVSADDDEVRVLDGATFAHELVTGDDAIDVVMLRDDHLELQTLEGRSAHFNLDGRRLDGPPPDLTPPEFRPSGVTFGDDDEPSLLRVDGKEWALPADGALRRGARVWAWTDEGFLVEI